MRSSDVHSAATFNQPHHATLPRLVTIILAFHQKVFRGARQAFLPYPHHPLTFRKNSEFIYLKFTVMGK